MFILFTISVIVLTSFICMLFWKYENSKYLKNIPGPKPHFLLGNLDKVIFLPRHKRLDLLMNLLKTYGLVMKVHAGPVHIGVICADAAFTEYILSSSKLIDKSDFYGFLHAWLGTGLLTSSGIKWKKRRRMITPAFHFSILENFVEVFENVGDTFIKKLGKEVGKSNVDLFPLVTLCTLDIICETAMGTKINAQNNTTSEYVRSVKVMCSIFADRTLSPVHRTLYPLTINYYREKRALKVLHGYTDRIIETRMSELSLNDEDDNKKGKATQKRRTFLDILLKSTIDGEHLSRRDIREEVDTFMFEGHDTTATAISFALYSLAVNPEVQKKAYLEQKQIFHKGLKNSKPSMAQLHEMKYLEMVLKESMRLYPSIPFLARKFPTDEEVVWDGNIFPKGINILISIYAIHRNPEYFPDPLKFNPERFEDTNRVNPFVFTPFSGGPRNCIGQKFAMLEMKSIVSKVLRYYELLPTDPVHELKLMPNVVLSSGSGICVNLRKRVDD